jgi:hypothetical protein
VGFVRYGFVRSMRGELKDFLGSCTKVPLYGLRDPTDALQFAPRGRYAALRPSSSAGGGGSR